MIRSLQPLVHREFRLLTAATLVSVLGDGLMRVALPLQVLAISGDDPLAISLVGFAWMVGHAASLPIGGVVSDRRDRRAVMIASDIVRAAVIGLMGLLGVFGILRLWEVLALGATFGFANGFFNPASRSLVPSLLPDEELPRGNALLSFARPLQQWIVGPLLAGAIVSVGGPGTALLLDAGTFLVSAVLLVAMRRGTRFRPPAPAGRAFAEMMEGIRYVRAHRWATVWLLTAGFSTLAFHGPFDVLVPTMLKVDLQLTEAQAGWWIAWIFAGGGAGALLASAFIGQRGLPRRFMTVLYISEAFTLWGLAAFAYAGRLWQAAVAGLVAFGATVLSEIIADTTMQREVPGALLGRVISLQWFLAIGLAPLSFVLAGPLGRIFGARPVLATIGLVAGAIVALAGLVPGARSPQHTRSRSEASELVGR